MLLKVKRSMEKLVHPSVIACRAYSGFVDKVMAVGTILSTVDQVGT